MMLKKKRFAALLSSSNQRQKHHPPLANTPSHVNLEANHQPTHSLRLSPDSSAGHQDFADSDAESEHISGSKEMDCHKVV